ncbi:MAG TPA: GvpL/GvpF family gas vesicle protein [Humisphaera sp.]|jgi:hypothetical protein|nr:GvpL/GvpF family gas vesicle protein [Humisphaera sp.]
MIYVYALIDSPAPDSPALCGLEEMPVRIVNVGQIWAICSDHTSAIAPSAENLWRHEAVIESFMSDERRGLLPARFSTNFANENELTRILSEHRERLMAAFDRVRGCVELGVRIFSRAGGISASRPVAADNGREYMLARLAADRQRRGTAEQVAAVLADMERALNPLARAVAQGSATLEPLPMSIAYLVPRNRAEEFSVRVREVAAMHPSFNLLCTGPWPAYHFAPSLAVAEALHV